MQHCIVHVKRCDINRKIKIFVTWMLFGSLFMIRRSCFAFHMNSFRSAGAQTYMKAWNGKSLSRWNLLSRHFLQQYNRLKIQNPSRWDCLNVQRLSTTDSFTKNSDSYQQWMSALQPQSKESNVDSDYEKEKPTTIQNLLICGDGDLSFSSYVTSELSELSLDHIGVTATVLEDEATHREGKFQSFPV